METNRTMNEGQSEMPEIPTTVIYRKNISQSSKSFLIDTLLSKDENCGNPQKECRRCEKENCFNVKKFFKFTHSTAHQPRPVPQSAQVHQ